MICFLRCGSTWVLAVSNSGGWGSPGGVDEVLRAVVLGKGALQNLGAAHCRLSMGTGSWTVEDHTQQRGGEGTVAQRAWLGCPEPGLGWGLASLFSSFPMQHGGPPVACSQGQAQRSAMWRFKNRVHGSVLITMKEAKRFSTAVLGSSRQPARPSPSPPRGI